MYEKIQNELKALSYKNVSLVSLAGDASSRSYFRVFHQEGSAVLMKRESFNTVDDPFYLVHHFFSELGVRIPKIYNLIPSEGIMILEDLGDTNLQMLNPGSNQSNASYIEATHILCKFQKDAETMDKTKFPLSLEFTFEKFYNELIMTNKYFLEKYKVKNYKEALVLNFYEKLVEEMLEQKFMLLHRDYHSKNIMIFNKELVLIDFQDARLGPYTYDLASLIIDPYSDLDASLIKQLIDTYYKKIQIEAYDVFFKNYLLCLLQRAIKILGTYSYQKFVKSNESYLKFIPSTVDKIKTIKPFFPEWEEAIEEVIGV